MVGQARQEAQEMASAREDPARRGSSRHESSWHGALGWPRPSAVISIHFRGTALDEGDDLFHQFGHLAREAFEETG
jgi:hypothetical protein